MNELSRDTENANNPLGQIFDKQKEQDRMDALDLVGDITAQAKDVANKYSKINAEKAFNDLSDNEKKALQDSTKEILEKQGIKDLSQSDINNVVISQLSKYEKVGNMGDSFSKGIDAAASIVTGLITGDIAGGLAGASAPYIAEIIKEQTYARDENGHIIYENGERKVNKEANLIAHAILGATVAQLQGNSALAGGVGAMTGEVAADIIRETLYAGKRVADSTQAEKENISALAQLASGLAVAAGTGGDVSDIGTAVAGSKNAVENNALTETKDLLSLDKEMAACKASGGNCDEVIQKYIDISNEHSKKLQEQCANGGMLCVTYEEFVEAGFNFAKGPADGQFYFGELMKDEHAKALAQILNGADLQFLKDHISTTDRVLAVVIQPTSWPFMIFGTRNILVNTATKGKEVLIAAEVSSGFNAAIQYGTTGEVKLSDVIGSGIVGSITAGKTYNPTVTWNAIGGYYTAELKGEDPFMGAILSKTGSSAGYATGSVIKIPFEKIFNKVSQKYEMVPTGVWSITKPVTVNNTPSILGNIGDSAMSEGSQEYIKEQVKGNGN